MTIIVRNPDQLISFRLGLTTNKESYVRWPSGVSEILKASIFVRQAKHIQKTTFYLDKGDIMKKKYSQLVMLGFSLISLFFIMSCGGGGEEGSAIPNDTNSNSTPSELQTTTVEISIQIPDDLSNARQLAASSQDVVRVTVDVT